MSKGEGSNAISVRWDPQAIIQQAVSGGATVETLERLLSLAREVRGEQAREAWNASMASFQKDIPEIKRTKTAKIGDRFSYTYAPLDEILSAIRPGLTSNGLSCTFRVSVEANRLTATCRISHEMGHTEESSFQVPVDTSSRMNAAQQVGSASTYARRYAVMNALGIAPDEDTDAQDVETPETSATRTVSVPKREAPMKQAASGMQERLEKLAENPPGGKVTTTVKGVTYKQGKKKDGSTWTRFAIDTASGQFATFSRSDAEIAKSIAGTGEQATVCYQKGEHGLDLMSIELENQPPEDDRPFAPLDEEIPI